MWLRTVLEKMHEEKKTNPLKIIIKILSVEEVKRNQEQEIGRQLISEGGAGGYLLLQQKICKVSEISGFRETIK